MPLPKKILLDTNFFIALRRGEPEALNLLRRLAPKQMVTSAIVQVEYAVGEFAVDPRREKSVEKIFSRFTVLPFEGKAAFKTMREAAKMKLPKPPSALV